MMFSEKIMWYIHVLLYTNLFLFWTDDRIRHWTLNFKSALAALDFLGSNPFTCITEIRSSWMHFFLLDSQIDRSNYQNSLFWYGLILPLAFILSDLAANLATQFLKFLHFVLCFAFVCKQSRLTFIRSYQIWLF